MRRVVAFAHRHLWPMTAAGVAMIAVSLCGILLAFQAMQHGWFLVGYLGGAACGDVLIWGVVIVAALWLPGRRAPTT